MSKRLRATGEEIVSLKELQNEIKDNQEGAPSYGADLSYLDE
jgi:hypothetical protein